MTVTSRWYSHRLEQEITVKGWGEYGRPVLLFPTAGGDAGEVYRHHVVDACSELMELGRVKLYSCDSVAGRAMVDETGSPEYRLRLLNQFQECIRQEVVPAIWADCGGEEMGVIAAGSSIGAFNAVAMLCRYPDVFLAAVGMSGSYRIERFYDEAWTQDLYYSAPMQFVPGLSGAHLDLLRQRFVVLASGAGAWEDVSESWRMAAVLGGQGIPNRVDDWGPEWEHDWVTWRAMVPQYLRELTGG